MKNILVVEDDKFLRDLLVLKLKSAGMKVDIATEGKEALQKIESKPPQLILLDLILPNIDGFEILKRIKKDEKTAKIPVIILSNLGEGGEVEKGVKLGAVDYLVKAHFTPEEIVAKVKKVLGEK